MQRLAEQYPKHGCPTLHDMLVIEGQIVDFSISGHRLARELDQLTRSLPRTIVCDSGPEFTSKAMYFWARKAGVKLHFIQPGKPTQNAFVESFNGKSRDGSSVYHEPPYTEPYVRWCGRTAGVTLPPTRSN